MARLARSGLPPSPPSADGDGRATLRRTCAAGHVVHAGGGHGGCLRCWAASISSAA